MLKDFRVNKASICHVQYSIKRKSKVISWAVCPDRSGLFPCEAPQLLQENSWVPSCCWSHPATARSCIYSYTIYLTVCHFLLVSAAHSYSFSLIHSPHPASSYLSLLIFLSYSQLVCHHLLAISRNIWRNSCLKYWAHKRAFLYLCCYVIITCNFKYHSCSVFIILS